MTSANTDTATADRHNVGGAWFGQPFKIRRFGHFGLWCRDIDATSAFYRDILGFRVTDEMQFSLKDGRQLRQVFTSHNTDHHSLVLGDAAFSQAQNDSYARGVTLNQLSFQVGSLQEIVAGQEFFSRRGIPMHRTGRDAPGSNWAVYAFDPDGNRVELFYGMEQIGWDGRSKPEALRYLGATTVPTLPQPCEADELREARDTRGIDLAGSIAPDPLSKASYDVGGILMPRPFKVTQMGPTHIFVRDLELAVQFYRNDLGLILTEEAQYKGYRAAFLRYGTDHHVIGLLEIGLRAELRLNPATDLLSVGMAVGSYDQLRDAASYLAGCGVTAVDTIPFELHPGMDNVRHFLDPEGHCIRLYVDIEQIGWNGLPRPAAQRRPASGRLPEVMDAQADAYIGQAFYGPIG